MDTQHEGGEAEGEALPPKACRGSEATLKRSRRSATSKPLMTQRRAFARHVNCACPLPRKGSQSARDNRPRAHPCAHRQSFAKWRSRPHQAVLGGAKRPPNMRRLCGGGTIFSCPSIRRERVCVCACVCVCEGVRRFTDRHRFLLSAFVIRPLQNDKPASSTAYTPRSE